MKKFLILFAAVFTFGCIHNDLPLPHVELEITAVTGDGFTCTPEDINLETRTVTLHLPEDTDIQAVKIDSISLNVTEGWAGEPVAASQPLNGTFDMRTPLEITLSLYQDYKWTIVAEQPIERYFTVEGQFGETEIDPAALTATAFVPLDTDLKNMTVTSLKLGPASAVTDPAMENLTDFSSVRYVTVTMDGWTEPDARWSLYVIPVDIKVQITKAEPWGAEIFLTGQGVAGTDLGFRYRVANDAEETEWIPVPDVEVNGGEFKAVLQGLAFETDYQIVAYSNDDLETVTTGRGEGIIPNGDLETWTETSTWFPCLESEIGGKTNDTYTGFWATGNPGTLFTQPDAPRPGSTGMRSAKLETKSMVGIIAAGNLFVGYFGGVHHVTQADVYMGRPYEFGARPKALRFWYKAIVGSGDKGRVYVMIGNMMGPHKIDTSNQSTFFSPSDETLSTGPIYGYADVLFETSVNEWTMIELPIEWRSKEKPNYLLISATSSYEGDYKRGSTDSKLWLDDVEFVY